ncbi:salivary glue protein Sgs-3-like [Drosophila subobscura]|uniref:salivary glue protein Sgs-3-like n=1 Tax=Drosophila subobscura TaxID=7241 RepID=UPI00155A44CD|nr:salivary glue protein Sgs-3-like [Drosophila subobscura]
MKLTIAIIASILLISLADLATGSACGCTDTTTTTCQPITTKSTTTKRTTCSTTKKTTTKATTKPTTTKKPSCSVCGPGGSACQGCPERENLCQELINTVRNLERRK